MTVVGKLVQNWKETSIYKRRNNIQNNTQSNTKTQNIQNRKTKVHIKKTNIKIILET